MTQSIVIFLEQYGAYAALISIGLNIIATVMAVFPTFFITAANIIFFGFWPGAFISFQGL